MYELLSDVTEVPVAPGSLIKVHTGMNKVKISVGEHISEPSEVYIATGEGDSGLETYIVFFMIEPSYHVIYGCDRNPYDPSGVEEVINEAIDFVEEMGSILEEIPWEGMSQDQRMAWIDKESLYQPAMEEEPELLEVVDEIEPDDLLEVVEDEEMETEPEILDELGLEIELEEDVPDDVTDELVIEPVENFEEAAEELAAEKEVRSAGDDVVVVDGDFDDLLKQAFLKPEVAKKTSKIKRKASAMDEPGKTVEEESHDPEIDADEAADGDTASEEMVAEDKGDEVPDEDEVVIPEEGPVPAPPPGASDQGPEQGVNAVVTKARVNEGPEVPLSADEKTLLDVVRFLSRF